MLRDTLLHAVTAYDRKQSTKRDYNVYALPQYLERVDDVMKDIDAGANAYDAINAGFCGPLLRHVIKTVSKAHPNLSPASKEKNEGVWTYQPVAHKT